MALHSFYKKFAKIRGIRGIRGKKTFFYASKAFFNPSKSTETCSPVTKFLRE